MYPPCSGLSKFVGATRNKSGEIGWATNASQSEHQFCKDKILKSVQKYLDACKNDPEREEILLP
eukprot:6153016-Prorocentrum_lima.AAC.1